MEVVRSWKPERCCEINTRFHGDGFLETNSAQMFPCQRSNKKNDPRLPLDYTSSRADKNGFIRTSEFIAHDDSFVSHSSFGIHSRSRGVIHKPEPSQSQQKED
jgi:hypothetical protein